MNRIFRRMDKTSLLLYLYFKSFVHRRRISKEDGAVLVLADLLFGDLAMVGYLLVALHQTNPSRKIVVLSKSKLSHVVKLFGFVEVVAADQPLLKTENLYKAYGGVIPTNRVSISVQTGHIHSLIGPNGAGKTTLLNILSGVVEPDSGSVAFNGRSIAGLAANKICSLGLARTFQNLKLFSNMTVLENVQVGLHSRLKAGMLSYLLGLPRARHEEASTYRESLQILELLGLKDKAHELAGSLPYGLQRRLEIARALAVDPKFILLDEPFAGVDPIAVEEIQSIVAKLKYRNIGILITDHNVDETLSITDRAYLLFEGKILKAGTPQELADDEQVRRLYLGKNFELRKKK